MSTSNSTLPAPRGKLAVLMPGLGAVSSTFIAGVALIKAGLARPIGSLTQLCTTPAAWPADGREVPLREQLGLTRLEDLVFGAWDIVDEDAERVARRSRVLNPAHIDVVAGALRTVNPRPGVHDPGSVRRIRANHVMMASTHRARISQLRQDIQQFKEELGAERAVMVFTASTEVYRPEPPFVHGRDALEDALDSDHPAITPTMLYAYAALQERVPFINATPNRSVETRGFQELAFELGVPVAGRDLKSGQTMMKTVIAPALKARMLGVQGWFSTNILGNRDGEVLDDPEAFRSKEVTKTSVLDSIFEPEQFPELYSAVSHKVAIHYYPPRGDEKESWDNIDLFGWLGYPMQIKMNFLCRDSILAAPLVLDLALFMDLARRLEWSGIQEWLSFYFKSPVARPGVQPEHDLFIQLAWLRQTLRSIAGDGQSPALAYDVGDVSR